MTVMVELFTSDSCPLCANAKARLVAAIDDLGRERFELHTFNVVEEIDHAVELGVLATPAIAIDGRLVHVGRLTVEKLKAVLDDQRACVP